VLYQLSYVGAVAESSVGPARRKRGWTDSRRAGCHLAE
jgi:hypothetical protein